MSQSYDPSRLPEPDVTWRDWMVPLACETPTLREALASADHIAADPNDIPLIIQMVENPKFDIPGLRVFGGAVNLADHDCIHALLGRGLLQKDEAFTIGFTMGSTNRMTTMEERMYTIAAKHLYPSPYKFGDEEIQVFKDAAHLGYVSDCAPLDSIDYDPLMDLPLREVREKIGLEVDLLTAYYHIEQRRYPQSKASRRLL